MGFEDRVFAHLNMNDPEEKALAEEIEESKEEHRKFILEKYPAPEDAIEPYRQGYIEMHDLQVAYTPEEVETILNECQKRNEEESREV